MRICVFGAGAVGGHIAARFAAQRHEVSVFARGVHLAAMRAAGVRLRTGGETLGGPVRGSDRAADLGPQDLVFVTLKANLLGVFAGAAQALLGRDTPVVFVQNGIPFWYAQGLAAGRPQPPELSRLDPGGALARAVAPERIVGAVVFSANHVAAPGLIENSTPGRNMLTAGEPDDRPTPRIAELRRLIASCGMHSPETRDIRQSIWGKLVLNLGSSTLCTLTGLTVGELMSDPPLARVRGRITEEGTAIARAHGIEAAGAPRRPGGQTPGIVGHKPSMLQDYERGRPMEIESQLMTPLAFARAAKVDAPAFELAALLCARRAAEKGLYAPA
jgi:2-dehydropantoate 2-reductase